MARFSFLVSSDQSGEHVILLVSAAIDGVLIVGELGVEPAHAVDLEVGSGGPTGVVIVDIANRSPLINLLSVGDVIIEVQKKSVKDTSDLNKIVSDIFKKGEKTLLLTVINKNNQRNYLGVKIN